MGKYWRLKGLHAVRFFLRALTFAALFFGFAQGVSAAPVTVFEVELFRHDGDFLAASRAVEKHFAEAEERLAAAEPAPEPRPEPHPTKIVAPADAQLPTPTDGTMTSTSVTSGGFSPSIPPATIADTPDLLLALSPESIETSDWLFIPPRFLDGIFRPPRCVVSH